MREIIKLKLTDDIVLTLTVALNELDNTSEWINCVSKNEIKRIQKTKTELYKLIKLYKTLEND